VSRRCLVNSIALGVILWLEIAAFLVDNAALMILGFFGALIWAWGFAVGGPPEEYVYDRDDERLPR
jgi:hypothetical protein